jgi:hypothetical protein
LGSVYSFFFGCTSSGKTVNERTAQNKAGIAKEGKTLE